MKNDICFSDLCRFISLLGLVKNVDTIGCANLWNCLHNSLYTDLFFTFISYLPSHAGFYYWREAWPFHQHCNFSWLFHTS